LSSRRIANETREARSEADLRAVQRFKYEIYVAEMGRYTGIADHDQRLLAEEDDPTSHHFLVTVDGKLAATMRLTWGGDDALTQRHVDQYDLAEFLAHLAPADLVVGERFMIDPAYRGSTILFDLFKTYMNFVNDRRIQLIFGDCEPHLLNTYQALGFRTYTERNVNSPETGYLIPLVIVAEDVEHMRRIASPLAEVLTDFGDNARVPANIDELLAGGAAVKLERADAEDFIDDFRKSAAEANALESGLFSNMSEEEIAVCLQKSAIIGCQPGDRVIKCGNVANNMGMVLSGYLEVRDGDKAIGRIGPGEMFGEIAFFLKLPRTMDVVAVEDGTKIVSLNDKAMRNLIESNSDSAARLLYNISRILCVRLKNTNELI
jgi:CRP-like cAMP-binding protein/predicted GNAT family N-acyltransferase